MRRFLGFLCGEWRREARIWKGLVMLTRHQQVRRRYSANDICWLTVNLAAVVFLGAMPFISGVYELLMMMQIKRGLRRLGV